MRLLIGILFIYSGATKTIEPYQNFQYIVEHYQLFDFVSAYSYELDTLVARVIPWLELFLGIFILLGLWLENALKTLGGLVVGFIIVISQALIRGLPIDDCGCFGESFSMPPQGMLIFDCCLLGLVILLLWKKEKTIVFSLDRWMG